MVRICPNCASEQVLREVSFHDQPVDLCGNCRGMFFHRNELEAVSSLVERFRAIVLEEPEIDNAPNSERARKLLCPNDGTLMDDKSVGGIWLDACASCGGTWVDGGEIAALKLAENQITANLTLYLRLGK